MNAEQAQGKIISIVDIISSEAEAKVKDIVSHGQAEYEAEVAKLVNEQKEKIRSTWEKKTKSVESAYAIAKSTAINRGRLEKVKARQEALGMINEECRKQLTNAGQDKGFITKLIVQGALMLLEPAVEVRCREGDVKMVESVLADASSLYNKQIKTSSGATKECKFHVSKSVFVPSTSLGGVTLACHDGKITIDNTIDLRLKLVLEQDKPMIRKLMFPN